MKHIAISITLLITAFAITGKSYSNNKSSTLQGAYLGQKPPGSTPEVFAPGIVSTTGYEYNGVFTPDMKEFYFIRGTLQIKNRNS